MFTEKDFLENSQKNKFSFLVEKLDFFVKPSLVFSSINQKNAVLLSSEGDKSNLSQYSIIAFDQKAVFVFKNSKGYLEIDKKRQELTGDPFNLLRQITKRFQPSLKNKINLPYYGGPIGFISYDACRYIENLPSLTQDDLNIADFYFILPQQIMVFDHFKQQICLIINEFIDNKPDKCLIRAKSKINNLKKMLPNPLAPVDIPLEPAESFSASLTKNQFEKACQKIIDYIYAGDVYQVNFSSRFAAPYTGGGFSLYKNLSQINPSPFAAYLNFEGFSLISSSPERLVCLRDGNAQTRPIAGTRRRGLSNTEDDFLESHLILDEKEKAEHTMLVDLERNDLGKVCEYETVLPTEFMVLEKYSHVIHIVSNIKGKLHQKKDQFDLIKAMFPGGTITGCPKVRCMEIIEELEPVRRGPYTGSIGYFGYNESMDFNIIIRSLVLKDEVAYFQAGAGIVADSVPKREYYETLSKAQALFASLGIKVKEKKWETLSI